MCFKILQLTFPTLAFETGVLATSIGGLLSVMLGVMRNVPSDSGVPKEMQ